MARHPFTGPATGHREAAVAVVPAALPLPQASILAVIRGVSSEKTSNRQLAALLLRDAAFAAQILKLVNSVCINRSGRLIDDIHKAILLLGFSRIQEIALATAVLETVRVPPRSHAVIALLACAFLTALQARSLAKCYQLAPQQRIFLAGLLTRLGEIWFYSEPDSAQRCLHQAGHEPVASRVSFDYLQQRLLQHWGIGDLLREPERTCAANARQPAAGFRQCLQQAVWLAEASRSGRETDEVTTRLQEIADATGQSIGRLQSEFDRNVRYAADVQRIFLLRGRASQAMLRQATQGAV